MGASKAFAGGQGRGEMGALVGQGTARPCRDGLAKEEKHIRVLYDARTRCSSKLCATVEQGTARGIASRGFRGKMVASKVAV